ncbi:unnamed protein product [Ectocarpus sp. 12 AP-2014]
MFTTLHPGEIPEGARHRHTLPIARKSPSPCQSRLTSMLSRDR